MTIKEQIEIVESHIAEYGVCDITIEEYKYLKQQIRAEAIDKFAHILKETFNNEFPSNYHCTQPYFTLDNVRVLTDAVAKEVKEQNR